MVPLAGMMGHGAAWGDVDLDGRPDLFVGGFCDRPDEQYAPSDGPVPTRLLRQTETGRFELVNGPPSGVYSRTSGAIFVDLDNDGRLDLYVANNARPINRSRPLDPEQAAAREQRSQLFHNESEGFVDVSLESGACPQALLTARNVAPFDIDCDGLLDLLVIEDRFQPSPRSVLLRNLGNLRFEDVTAECGLPDDLYGLGHAIADLNDDGRPDFFIGHSNRLFLSTPDGLYEEPAALRNLFAWDPLHGEDWPCGAAFGDLDRDGDLDMVLGIHCETARNRLYLNEGLEEGVPRFRDATSEVGLPESVPQKCPHVEIQDFDNDGWPDLYFSAAWRDADGAVTPLIFRHLGLQNGVPRFAPPREIGSPMVYYASAPSCDYDGDGRMDLFLVNWFADDHCHLLRNEATSGHWLDVTVEGHTFNRMGIGSRVHVYESGRAGDPDGLLGMQELNIGTGYASGHVAVAHFGLGEVDAVDVVVRFPTGATRVVDDIAVDQRLHVPERLED